MALFTTLLVWACDPERVREEHTKSVSLGLGTPPGSALIFGSRQCGLASRFTSLARGRGLATRRAPFSRQCALLAGCEFSLRFGFHMVSLSF